MDYFGSVVAAACTGTITGLTRNCAATLPWHAQTLHVLWKGGIPGLSHQSSRQEPAV